MTVLDSTIANIALPTIATELNASASTSIWIVNSYQLAITMLLLPLAALGDRIGYQRVYVPGLVIFVLGSLACALSHTLWQLIAARVLQGIGSAGIMSMNSAMVRGTYPQAVLGRGIGYNALVLSLSAAAGPSVAAAILSVAPWPWLFAINVPMGIAAYLIGARSLPQTQGHGGKPNLPSAALSALAIGGLVFGGEKLGRGELHVAVPLLLVALVAGVLLVLRDRARPAPLLPIDLLRIPIFSLSLCTSIVSFGAQMLAYITLPFLLQSVMGRSGTAVRPAPYRMAARRGMHGAARRTPRRSLPRGAARRHRPRCVRHRARMAVAAGHGSQHAHAGARHGSVRRRFRLLPVTEQSHHRGVHATRALRRRGRPACNGAPARPDRGRGDRGRRFSFDGRELGTPCCSAGPQWPPRLRR